MRSSPLTDRAARAWATTPGGHPPHAQAAGTVAGTRARTEPVAPPPVAPGWIYRMVQAGGGARRRRGRRRDPSSTRARPRGWRLLAAMPRACRRAAAVWPASAGTRRRRRSRPGPRVGERAQRPVRRRRRQLGAVRRAAQECVAQRRTGNRPRPRVQRRPAPAARARRGRRGGTRVLRSAARRRPRAGGHWGETRPRRRRRGRWYGHAWVSGAAGGQEIGSRHTVHAPGRRRWPAGRPGSPGSLCSSRRLPNCAPQRTVRQIVHGEVSGGRCFGSGFSARSRIPRGRLSRRAPRPGRSGSPRCVLMTL
ncbi:hypothetical protein SVIOM74S_04561 [Streptomyces violarus]